MSLPRAKALYKTFTEFDPKSVRAVNLVVPATLECWGPCKAVMYASNKWSGHMENYKHDHGEGVKIYVPSGPVTTPKWIKGTTALAELGRFLGAEYEDGELEAAGCGLYSVPSGKALFVVHKKDVTIEAIIWGGKLRVEARGIVD